MKKFQFYKYVFNLLYIFFLIIFSSLFVVISNKSVTSVLYLINTFILSILSLLLLGADFLSILIMIIYIGAIAILFLFVIMMLNLRIVEVYNSLVKLFPIGSFLGYFYFLVIYFILKNDFNINTSNLFSSNFLESNFISFYLVKSYNNLFLIGDVLYNNNSLLLIIAGLILLLAMLGAIILTLDTDNKIKVDRNKNFSLLKLTKIFVKFWGRKN